MKLSVPHSQIQRHGAIAQSARPLAQDQRSHRLALICLHYVIVVFSGAFLEQFLLGSTVGANSASLGRTLNSVSYLPAYLIALYLLTRPADGVFGRSAIFAYLSFLIFALLALLSVVWALRGTASAIDSLQLALTTLTAIALVRALPAELAMRHIAYNLMALMLLSLVWVYLIPALGRMQTEEFSNLANKPQGVFSHKNRYAELAAMGLLCALALREMPFQRLQVVFILACLMGLVLSDSASKNVAVSVTIALFVTWRWLRSTATSRLKWFILAAFATALCLVSVPLAIDAAVAFLGKDLTLSGRTLIWSHAFDMIAQRPLLGYGASSIWSGFFGTIDTFANYRPPHSHNLYIETLLRFGLVGLVLMIIGLLRLIGQLIVTDGKTWQSSFLFLLFFVHFIRSPFEVVLFRDNQIGYLMVLIAFGFAVRHQIEQQTQTRLEGTSSARPTR